MSPRNTAQAPAPVASPRPAGTLLLVEDSDADAHLIGDLLGDTRQADQRVERCRDIAEAAAVLRGNKPTCVLLDLALPGVHAIEGLATLRGAAPTVPIVVLTGLDDDAMSRQALVAGAQDYLRKDQLDANLLSHSIRSAIERGRIECQLAQKQEELERSNDELNRFASIASHDLSSPLRSIAGFAEILREKHSASLDERGVDYLRRIGAGAIRMRTLIDDLLAFARTGQAELKPEPTDAKAVTQEVLLDLSDDVASANGHVTVGPLPTLATDPSQLRQLLQNLICNALKFAGDGDSAVTIDAARMGSMWRFEVSDNGIGVPEAEREQIFDALHRLHGRDEFPGAGLGLAICRRIVRRQGGDIWCEETVGGGCRFVFTLPALGHAGP